MPDPAIAVAVAEAVKAQIAAGTWSRPFDLERSYADWAWDLKDDSEKPKVDVVANTTAQTVDQTSFDGRLSYTIPIDVAVRFKFGPDKQVDDTGRIQIEAVDDLVAFAQELWEQLPDRLTELEDAAYTDTTIVVCPDKKSLRELRQFAAVFRLIFTVDRGVP